MFENISRLDGGSPEGKEKPKFFFNWLVYEEKLDGTVPQALTHNTEPILDKAIATAQAKEALKTIFHGKRKYRLGGIELNAAVIEVKFDDNNKEFFRVVWVADNKNLDGNEVENSWYEG